MMLRVLPPEEWSRLEGTEAESVWETFNPNNTRVLVVEDDGKIVGTWTMLRTVHAECVWVDPKYRGSYGVTSRLLKGMRSVAKEWDVHSVITGSVSSDVTNIIERLGGIPMPCESFVLPLWKGSRCQQ